MKKSAASSPASGPVSRPPTTCDSCSAGSPFRLDLSGVIAVLPNLFLEIGNTGGVQNLPFGGTAVLIMIGVGLDTVKQIESQLMQRNYEGFLK